MVNETKEMRDARWELKMLSAADREATSNMLRYVAALSIMMTGRLQRSRMPGEPRIGACFLLDDDDTEFLMALAGETGIDQIHVGFDVDDAAGPPRGFGIIRAEGDETASYGNCRLWAPANDGRPVLVPIGSGPQRYFSFRKDGPLTLVAGRPAEDMQPGFRRASARFARLLASHGVRAAGAQGYMHVISNDDGVFTSRPTSIAA